MVVTQTLTVATSGRGPIDLTARIAACVRDSGVRNGIVSLFVRHTSASLMLNENADPVVLDDLERFMSRLVVDGDPVFRHTAEGADDMAAHVRTLLTQTDLNLPVRDGTLRLGTWQGVFLWEHRVSPHRRELDLTVMGEA